MINCHSSLFAIASTLSMTWCFIFITTIFKTLSRPMSRKSILHALLKSLVVCWMSDVMRMWSRTCFLPSRVICRWPSFVKKLNSVIVSSCYCLGWTCAWPKVRLIPKYTMLLPRSILTLITILSHSWRRTRYVNIVFVSWIEDLYALIVLQSSSHWQILWETWSLSCLHLLREGPVRLWIDPHHQWEQHVQAPSSLPYSSSWRYFMDTCSSRKQWTSSWAYWSGMMLLTLFVTFHILITCWIDCCHCSSWMHWSWRCVSYCQGFHGCQLA